MACIHPADDLVPVNKPSRAFCCKCNEEVDCWHPEDKVQQVQGGLPKCTCCHRLFPEKYPRVQDVMYVHPVQPAGTHIYLN